MCLIHLISSWWNLWISNKTCVDYISKEDGVSPYIVYNELNEVLKNRTLQKELCNWIDDFETMALPVLHRMVHQNIHIQLSAAEVLISIIEEIVKCSNKEEYNHNMSKTEYIGHALEENLNQVNTPPHPNVPQTLQIICFLLWLIHQQWQDHIKSHEVMKSIMRTVNLKLTAWFDGNSHDTMKMVMTSTTKSSSSHSSRDMCKCDQHSSRPLDNHVLLVPSTMAVSHLIIIISLFLAPPPNAVVATTQIDEPTCPCHLA